jgi:Trypsin
MRPVLIIPFYRYRVRLGDHQTNSANDSITQDARIDAMFSHENYTRTIITNDIALIKLKDKVNFTGENILTLYYYYYYIIFYYISIIIN